MSHEKTISEWFQLYSNAIYQFLIYRMGTTDVEDYVQETFIKAFRKLDTFKGEAEPKTWLFSIARHVALDGLQKRKRQAWKRYFNKGDLEPVSNDTPEEVLGFNDESLRIYEAIKELKDSYRDVVVLRGIKELSVQETSQILNWSESKVRSTYHRARQVLKEKLGGLVNE